MQIFHCDICGLLIDEDQEVELPDNNGYICLECGPTLDNIIDNLIDTGEHDDYGDRQ